MYNCDFFKGIQHGCETLMIKLNPPPSPHHVQVNALYRNGCLVVTMELTFAFFPEYEVKSV